MTRRLFNILTAVTLLLCVALCVVWVRSYWSCVVVNRSKPGDSVTGRICRGRVVILRVVEKTLTDAPGAIWIAPGVTPIMTEPKVQWRVRSGDPRRFTKELDNLALNQDWSLASFSASSYTSPNITARAWAIPLWAPMLALVAVPSARFLMHRIRGRLARAGQCPSCGYNLTGNVSGVCPECGSSP